MRVLGFAMLPAGFNIALVGVLGVWLSFPLSFVVRALAMYFAYRRGRWAVTGVGVGPRSAT